VVSTITDRVAGAVDGAPVQRQGFGIVQVTDSAGTDTYTGSTSPTITAYHPNQLYLWRPFAANTGAATLNLEGLGAKDVRMPNGAALSSGYLSASQDYLIRYDETADDFIIVAPF
jgi:hypothetical protein